MKARYDRVVLQASYFYTFIEDQIVRVPTGQTVNGLAEVTKLNSGTGHVQGFEIEAVWEFYPEWSLRGAFTWQQGVLDTYSIIAPTPVPVTEPVSRLMPPSGLIGLRWDASSGQWWAEALGFFAAKQDELSGGDQRDTQRIPPGGTPGYATGTVRGGWQPCAWFDLTVAIENLSDADFRVHGSGVNEPGRNFILAADVRF